MTAVWYGWNLLIQTGFKPYPEVSQAILLPIGVFFLVFTRNLGVFFTHHEQRFAPPNVQKEGAAGSVDKMFSWWWIEPSENSDRTNQ